MRGNIKNLFLLVSGVGRAYWIASFISFLGLVIFYYIPGLSSNKFNQQYWLDHKKYDAFVRYRMHRDLLPQLIGKNGKEVVELLGQDEFYGQDRVAASRRVIQAPDSCQMKYQLSHIQTDSKLPYLCIELVNGEVRSSRLIEYASSPASH